MISNSSSSLEISKLSANERSLYFSLVIPTYNESQNIKELVAVLSKLLDEFLPNNYELIVVDDDSPDRTWEVAESLIVDYPQLKVLRRKGERGLSTAVIRGWQNADGEVLGVIDGDLQHPPERLLKLLAAIQSGADLAVASRHIETGGVSNWNLARRFLSRGAQLLGLIILPGVIGRVSDPMSGYFAVRRDAICDRPLHPIGYKILIEVLARGAISKVTEIGYVFQERQEGESKVTWKQYLEYISHLIRLRLSLGEFTRFLRFGLVGFSGVFVDMTVLYLLHDPASLGWELTRSKLIAGEIAIINNFLWNDAWTFRDLSNKQSTWKSKLKRFIKFNLVCLIGLGLNILLLNLFFNVLHIHYLVANFLAIAIVTVWNFWINLKLSWRVTDTDK
jgi:dolichol-phosphate mannosyltransferase